MLDMDSALRRLVELDGSDLHIKVGTPPIVRVNGALGPLDGHEEGLTAEETERAFHDIAETRSLTEFEDAGEADFAYSIPGYARFRVSAFKQRGSVSIVCRAIPFQVKTIEELGLPDVVRELADSARGIVLLTGTTGSGKSTTLAAMIDHINRTKARHVVTLEDPIEYLHRDRMSIINQREIGADTESFGRGMRRVLRQDPDVILIGEMRDEETVRTALSAAETGHLVFSTLHTLDATETINRIIDFFPPHLQQQARVMLSSTLRGAISQRLIERSDCEGRVAAAEVMVSTGRVKDLIMQPEETGKISEVIAEGAYYGMRTFDQDLLDHVQAGRVSEETALAAASRPHDFKLMLEAGGQRASGIEQISTSESAGGRDSAASGTNAAPAGKRPVPEAPAPPPTPGPPPPTPGPPPPAPGPPPPAPVAPAPDAPVAPAPDAPVAPESAPHVDPVPEPPPAAPQPVVPVASAAVDPLPAPPSPPVAAVDPLPVPPSPPTAAVDPLPVPPSPPAAAIPSDPFSAPALAVTPQSAETPVPGPPPGYENSPE